MVIERYWSRTPGKFVNEKTGEEIVLSDPSVVGPNFQGTVREWYESLVEMLLGIVDETEKCARCDKVKVITNGVIQPIIESTIAFRPLPASLDSKCPALVGTLFNSISVYYSHLADPAALTILSEDEHLAVVYILDLKR
jgi:hypothetical protein